jgi:hypothetical protein
VRDQGLVGGHRVVGQVDGAQQAGEAGRVLRAGQLAQRGGHRGVRAGPGAPAAVPVVGAGVAVEADRDPHAQRAQPARGRPVEPHRVGLHAEPQVGEVPGGPADRRHAVVDLVQPGQQRLAAVQGHPDRGEGVPAHVLGDPVGGLVDRAPRHDRRAVGPAAVAEGVDVAVVAGQVAAAVHLEQELVERVRRRSRLLVHGAPTPAAAPTGWSCGCCAPPVLCPSL